MIRQLDYLLIATLLAATVLAAGVISTTSQAGQGDWAFKPSYYSHDPASGERVAQYAPAEKAYADIDNYRRSGYRQQRIRIQSPGGSADNIHLVETWGEGEFIRPYGEWLRPFREGATPYGPWGNAQGPWTLPFESWVNPYGLGNLPTPPWVHWQSYSMPHPSPSPYPSPTPYPSPSPSPVYGPMPYGGAMGGYGGGAPW